MDLRCDERGSLVDMCVEREEVIYGVTVEEMCMERCG